VSNRVIVIIFLTFILFIGFFSCDIYKSENKNWKNEVKIEVRNEALCGLDIYIDGNSADHLEPTEFLNKDNIGQGIHLLEAFTWDKRNHACEFVYTPLLKKGDSYLWEIVESSQCSVCDPTPTPAPTSQYSPTPTPTPW
jgi:hypothetical protein